MAVPDPHCTWIPAAIATAVRLHRRQRFDLVFSSGGPWSAHLVGLMLKTMTGVPWIADYRDPWTLAWPFHLRKPAGIRMMERNMETRVLAAADAVVFVTSQLRDEYVKALDRKSVV